MGQSTNAMFFFGINVVELDESFPRAVVEKLLELVKNPEDLEIDEYGDSDPYAVEAAFDELLIPDWSDKSTHHPLLVGMHCHIESPMFYLALRRTHIQALRGFPESIPPDLIQANVEAMKEELSTLASEFCFELDRDKIGWKLCSYWG